MRATDESRRSVCVALAGFAALHGVLAAAQSVPTSAGVATGAGPGATDDGGARMALSKVFRMSEMPVTQTANGGWARQVVHGVLLTGEFVEVHETMLPPGQRPHPPHQHRNSEFILIREGRLECLNNGRLDAAGVGDVLYLASEQMHGLRNSGETQAVYFVVSVSRATAAGAATP